MKRFTRAGEIFEIPIEPIIDPATLAAYEARREANKSSFVEKVHVDRERHLTVTLRLDVLALAGQVDAIEWFSTG